MKKQATIGRPPLDNPKSERKMVRLNQDDLAAILKECDRLHKTCGGDWTVSRFLREAGRLAFRKRLLG